MFANKNELTEAITKGMSVYGDNLVGTPEQRAEYILDYCKRQCLSGQYYGKENNRPWQLVDLKPYLSSSSAWVGYEFEMGFHNDEDRRKVVSFVWDNINHSAQDHEGYGGHVLEATFKPQNFEEYTAGTSDIQKLYDFLAKEKIPLHLPPEGTGACGTHANISTPLFRKLTQNQAQQVVRQLTTDYNFQNVDTKGRLNREGEAAPNSGSTRGYPAGYFTVYDKLDPVNEKWILTPEDKNKYFGRRSPYSWCNFRPAGHYIEFKVFASTDRPEKFKDVYLKTTQCLIDIIDEYSQALLDKKPLPALFLKERMEAAHAPPVEQRPEAVIDVVKKVTKRTTRKTAAA